jgi:SAM-dependent methyltransferase
MAHAGLRPLAPAAPQSDQRTAFLGFMALAEAAAKDGDVPAALRALAKAAEAEPAAAAPHTFRALVLGRAGRAEESLKALATAIGLEPDHMAAKVLLARVIAREPKGDYRWMAAGVVRACLATDGIGHREFAAIAQVLLVEGPLGDVLVEGATKGWDGAAAKLLGEAGRRLRSDGLLLGLLREGRVTHVPVERLCEAARRRLTLEPWPARDTRFLAFVGALAEQSYLDDYVWFAADDERAALDQLATRSIDGPDAEIELLTFGLHAPLERHPKADAILAAEARFGEALRRLIALTLDEARAERAAAGPIPALTDVRDPTSLAVQGRHDGTHPPRWRDVTLPAPGATRRVIETRIDRSIRLPDRPRVLIAGCGSGEEALRAAVTYGIGAEVTVIDLSRARLGAVARRAERMGVKGLSFAVADILELRAEVPFDVIECLGALPSMADPARGLDALAGLLAPKGIMRLGFASERGRRFVGEAVAAARARGIDPTEDGVRAFRHWMLTEPPGPWAVGLTRHPAFYALGPCRELLFPVHQHAVSPSGLGRFLAEAGLAFRGFEVANAEREAFKRAYPDDRAWLDLERWETFEELNAEAFRTGYLLWCVKST